MIRKMECVVEQTTPDITNAWCQVACDEEAGAKSEIDGFFERVRGGDHRIILRSGPKVSVLNDFSSGKRFWVGYVRFARFDNQAGEIEQPQEYAGVQYSQLAKGA